MIGVFPSEEVHEFHLSKSTINYNTKEQSLQITLNMFIDDLESALDDKSGTPLYICTKKELDSTEDIIYQYISTHLKIQIDGNKSELLFIGKEQSEDLIGVWCYLEIPDVVNLDKLVIDNTIMIEIYNDQKNMTTIQKDKKRIQDILFTSKKTSVTIRMHD